jgi:hypothetical protein
MASVIFFLGAWFCEHTLSAVFRFPNAHREPFLICMIKSSHKRQLERERERERERGGRRRHFTLGPKLKEGKTLVGIQHSAQSESSSIRLTVCGTKRRLKANTSHRADCMQTLCVQFLIIIRVARNDGAQKYSCRACSLFVCRACIKITETISDSGGGSAGERN